MIYLAVNYLSTGVENRFTSGKGEETSQEKGKIKSWRWWKAHCHDKGLDEMINMGKPKAQRAAEDAPEPRQPRSLSLGNNPVPTSHKNSSSWMPSGARTNRAIALKRKKKIKTNPLWIILREFCLFGLVFCMFVWVFFNAAPKLWGLDCNCRDPGHGEGTEQSWIQALKNTDPAWTSSCLIPALNNAAICFQAPNTSTAFPKTMM